MSSLYSPMIFNALSGGGGGINDSFTTIQTPNGTYPVASGVSTLNLTSLDNSITITGNSGTDSVNYVINSSFLPSASTYTPTYTAITNTTIITSFNSMYHQIGDYITVYFKVECGYVSSGMCRVSITFPFASALENIEDVIGCANGADGSNDCQRAVVYGDTTNNYAVMEWQQYGYDAEFMGSFMYKVI